MRRDLDTGTTQGENLYAADQQHIRWRRLAACVALGVCIALLSAVFHEGGSASNTSTASVQLLQESGGSFLSWYRQQSADSWFGHATFDSQDTKGKKREHAKWMSKEDLATIPIAEQERAEKRLKSRMVQLALNTMMVKDKSQR
jgi:hypothetical protein